ncbi:M13 family metallopeptidase [Francisella tularensis]|uniref:M13 family metallopeptidase n=1 Tax=Francisella tularensis TaxID=263 RepID=UPI0034A0CC6A
MYGSINEKDDFYRYINGKWLDNVSIPADENSWGSFMELRKNVLFQQHEVIDELNSQDIEAQTDRQRVYGLYQSYMNLVIINKLGLKPLANYLESINSIEDNKQLVDFFAKLNKIGSETPLKLSINIDAKNSSQMIVSISQGSLGLPNRDYYLDENEKFVKIRNDYLEYIIKLLQQVNIKNPEEAAQKILSLETLLAEIQFSEVENRDPDKIYNKFKVSNLNDLYPYIEWNSYLKSAEIPETEKFIIIKQLRYIIGLGNLLNDIPLNTWKIYLKYRLVNAFAPLLSENFYNLNFNFYGKNLTGLEKDKPRSEKAIMLINDSIGEAFGKLYVQKFFPQDKKEKVLTLVKYIIKVFDDRIDKLKWMGSESKKHAKAKFDNMHIKIGFPDKWKDYTALSINSDDLIGNVIHIKEFNYNQDLDTLGKPVDKSKWYMPLQMVNAYYNPEMNEIVFPAAIFQPPFFDADADMAANYGGIGAVIGHEISHAFDDQGSKFDYEGNLKEWMTKEDRMKFKAITQKLVEQYSVYEPIKGIHVNGELTLGENIADNAGLAVAYDAYKLSLNGQQAPVIDNYTGAQRFYMGWSQIWRGKFREGRLLELLKSDPHAPIQIRGQAPLKNQDGFYETYNIKFGDGMYLDPEQRVNI